MASVASSSSSALSVHNTASRAPVATTVSVSPATAKLVSLSSRLLREINGELDASTSTSVSASDSPNGVSSFAARLKTFVWKRSAIWSPRGGELSLPPNGAAAALHADGSEVVALPFPVADPAELEAILSDSEVVARMQAGVSAVSRSVLPLLQQIDAAFIAITKEQQARPRRSGATAQLAVPPSTFHIGLAYRAIKQELKYVMSRLEVKMTFVAALVFH